MNLRSSATLGVVAALVGVAVLPFLGRALGGPPPPRCPVDGVALEGAPLVRFETSDGPPVSFCCIACATAWIRTIHTRPTRVTVMDAVTGEMVDATTAWFVRSRVIAQPATRDRTHAFASREEATRHAETYHGVLLSGEDRPFGPRTAQEDERAREAQ